MKNNDFIPSLRDESQDLPKQSKDSPSLAEGDTGGGLKAQNNSGVKFSNDKSTHPLTPSAREGVDLGLPSVRERGQVGKSHNDDKNYKRFAVCFVWSLFVATLLGIALGFLLWLYDPFMFFHKPYFREQTYMTDLRASARGIIDYAEFDSVILGSSVLANTSSKEANQKLGGKWVNLTLWGSILKDRAILLEYLFKHKKIKSIIYSLDAYALISDHKPYVDMNPLRYSNDSLFAKWRDYLDTNFIKCAIRWSNKKECVGQKELESIASILWFLDNVGGITKWNPNILTDILESYNSPNDFLANTRQNMQRYNEAEKYLFKIIEKNPQIDFHFLIPTQPRLFYSVASIKKMKAYYKGRTPNEYLADWKEMLKWLVDKSAQYQNMQIYGFDDTDYPDNIANFGDLEHPNIDMNSMQLDAIANGTHILTPQNIDTYLATMESKIKNYDITPLIAEIKAWEAQQM